MIAPSMPGEEVGKRLSLAYRQEVAKRLPRKIF